MHCIWVQKASSPSMVSVSQQKLSAAMQSGVRTFGPLPSERMLQVDM